MRSEAQYLKAISIFTVHFSQDYFFAVCIQNLGNLYKEMHRHEESEAQYVQAASIYSAYHSQEIIFAVCLFHLGKRY